MVRLASTNSRDSRPAMTTAAESRASVLDPDPDDPVEEPVVELDSLPLTPARNDKKIESLLGGHTAGVESDGGSTAMPPLAQLD